MLEGTARETIEEREPRVQARRAQPWTIADEEDGLMSDTSILYHIIDA